jgi:methionyl-tRNA formyltransferase
MTQHKIFFFGTPEIAVPSLEILAKLPNIEIIGVGIFPDRPVGRKKVLTSSPVKSAAQKLNLPIYEIIDKAALLTVLKDIEFDLGIVIAFGMIFPHEAFKGSPLVNVHFSCLPHWRGASPVQSAILNDEKTSGITFQKLAPKLDAGDVLFKKESRIEGKPTSVIFADFAQKTAEIMPKFLDQYFSEGLVPQPQIETEATFCTKFSKADGEVFPLKETAHQIYQKYLAFDIWPGVFLETSKRRLKLLTLSEFPTLEGVPLNCANETVLYVERAQIAGKSALPMMEVLKGHPNVFDEFVLNPL